MFRKDSFFYILFLMIIPTLLFFSCSYPTHGLFFTVGNEVSITQMNSGLPKTFTPTRIDLYNGVYIVTGSVLYGTTAAGTWADKTNNHIALQTWTTLTLPMDDVSVFSTAVFDNELFILSIGNNSNSSVSIYRTKFNSDGSSNIQSYKDLNNSSWLQTTDGIDLTNINTSRPCQLFSVNNELMLMTRTEVTNGATYSLFRYSASSDTWTNNDMSLINTISTNDGSSYSPYVGIIYTAEDSIWWFIKSNGDVYSVNGSITNPPSLRNEIKTLNIANSITDPMFRGAYADDSDDDGLTDIPYLLSGKGFIMRSLNSGSSWEVTETIDIDTSSTIKPVGFSTATRVKMKDIRTNEIVTFMMFGSSGDDARYYSDGLYYISDNSSFVISEFGIDNGNYNSTKLINNGINYIYFDNTSTNNYEKPVFVCSSTNGLWSALVNSQDKINPSLIWAWE